MELYKVKVKHDYGTAILRVSARSWEDALRTIMRDEKCPASAIIWAYKYGHGIEL